MLRRNQEASNIEAESIKSQEIGDKLHLRAEPACLSESIPENSHPLFLHLSAIVPLCILLASSVSEMIISCFFLLPIIWLIVCFLKVYSNCRWMITRKQRSS